MRTLLSWLARGVLPAVFAVSSFNCGSTTPASGQPADTTDSGAPVDAGGDETSDDAAPIDTSPQPSCPVGTAFEQVAGKILIDVTINGGASQKWILDTGASNPLLDTKVVLGTGPYVLHIAGHDFKVNGIERGDVATSLQIPGVVGIFGMDLFSHAKKVLTVDYPRSVYWIDDARDDASLLACTHVAGKPIDVPFKYDYDLYVQGSLEDQTGWFIVDSGATLDGVPDDVFDALNKAHPRPALDGFYTPALIGTFWARMTAMKSITVGGMKVDHLVARTIDPALLPSSPDPKSPLLGLLPSGWLHHSMMTIDFSTRLIRFDPKKDDALAEPAQYFVVGIGLEKVTDPPIHVTQVLAGSSAEEAGVAVGDRLVSIGGKDVASLQPYSRPWALMSATLGKKISVTLERVGVSKTYDLEVRDLLRDP